MPEDHQDDQSAFVWDDEEPTSHSNWSGSSTPPDIYGSLSKDELTGSGGAYRQEVTVEDDRLLVAQRRLSTTPGQMGLDDCAESGDSGEYQVGALEPLRRSLERDWADPELRGRLRGHVQNWAKGSDGSGEDKASVDVNASTAVAGASPKPELRTPATGSAAAKATKPEIAAAIAASFRTKRVFILLLAGGAAVVLALGVPKDSYLPHPVTLAAPRFILSSEPKADVYRGKLLLGTTPLLLEVSQAKSGLRLSREGYQAQDFSFSSEPDSKRVEKVSLRLVVAPVALNWEELPAGSTVFWNGVKSDVASLQSALPGSYRVKVIAGARPAVEASLLVPEPDATATTSLERLAPGALIAELFAKQPLLSISVDYSKIKKVKLPIKVSILELDVKNSAGKSVSLDGKAPRELAVARPGLYRVSVASSSQYLAYSKKVTLKEAAREKLQITLLPLPKKAAPPLIKNDPGAGGYLPPPVYYPPPRYYPGGGGGGGGGRIAPPSF